MDEMPVSRSILFVAPAQGIKPPIVLSSLLKHPGYRHDIRVWTDPPREHSPLIQVVEQYGLEHRVVEDLSLVGECRALCEEPPDFLVSCGWGARIAADVLDIPRLAALNCHSSFLPDYKGHCAYRHAWANCEPAIGATVHYMTERFDDGRILTQEQIQTWPSDTPRAMLVRLSELTAVLLREALWLAADGVPGTAQNGGRYFLKITSGRLRLHRAYNRMAVRLGWPRWLTPHRTIPPRTKS